MISGQQMSLLFLSHRHRVHLRNKKLSIRSYGTPLIVRHTLISKVLNVGGNVSLRIEEVVFGDYETLPASWNQETWGGPKLASPASLWGFDLMLKLTTHFSVWRRSGVWDLVLKIQISHFGGIHFIVIPKFSTWINLHEYLKQFQRWPRTESN